MKGIHQVIGNLVRTYNIQEANVYDNIPYMDILGVDAFAVRSTYHHVRGNIRISCILTRNEYTNCAHSKLDVYNSMETRKNR